MKIWLQNYLFLTETHINWNKWRGEGSGLPWNPRTQGSRTQRLTAQGTLITKPNKCCVEYKVFPLDNAFKILIFLKLWSVDLHFLLYVFPYETVKHWFKIEKSVGNQKRIPLCEAPHIVVNYYVVENFSYLSISLKNLIESFQLWQVLFF